MWCGIDQKKSIHWVKWSKVCTPKDKGGLGITNTEAFNVSLLMKWKWRIIHDKEAVWFELLQHRYGNTGLAMMNGEGRTVGRKCSIWWRDILSLSR